MNSNLKLFKELIEKYRSITMETLLEAKETMVNEGYDSEEFEPVEILSYLTGFGCIGSCTLCVVYDNSLPNPCQNCVWTDASKNLGTTMPCINSFTYHNVNDAVNLDQLLISLRERADYMEEWLKQKGLYDKEG